MVYRLAAILVVALLAGIAFAGLIAIGVGLMTYWQGQLHLRP